MNVNYVPLIASKFSSKCDLLLHEHQCTLYVYEYIFSVPGILIVYNLVVLFSLIGDRRLVCPLRVSPIHVQHSLSPRQGLLDVPYVQQAAALHSQSSSGHRGPDTLPDERDGAACARGGAIGLLSLFEDHEESIDIIKPFVAQLLRELLLLVKETENDDIADALRDIIRIYGEDISGIAVDLCTSLVQTFSEIYDINADSPDIQVHNNEAELAVDDAEFFKSLVAMGILNSILSLLTAMSSNLPLLSQLEPGPDLGCGGPRHISRAGPLDHIAND